jgi:uncharacterized protein (DUF2147 family)
MGWLLLAALALVQDAAPIEGRWRSPGGNSIIDIAPCGDDLCGTVAWASEKAKADARKAADPLVGTQLLTGLRERKAGRWQGSIFIPDRNMRATARLQLVGPDQLKVSGCAMRILCSTQIWSRYDQPLPE